jgi:hypothetical protein
MEALLQFCYHCFDGIHDCRLRLRGNKLYMVDKWPLERTKYKPSD